MDMERRTILNTPVEVRAGKGGATKLLGRAVPYWVLSEDLGGFREQWAPGSLTEVLKTSDAYAAYNHDPSQLLGRESAGTLHLQDGRHGLDYIIDPLPDTMIARDVVENVRLGNIQGNSFSFSVAEGGDVWDRDDTGMAIRTVTKAAALYEVGPVVIPAFSEGTTVSARSLRLAKRLTERRGLGLGNLLSILIDRKITDDKGREDIMAEAGEEAGISGSTVGEIVAGEIKCPPLERLRGFARYFDVPLSRLQDAAESLDGCDYGDDRSVRVCGDRSRQHRLIRAKQSELEAKWRVPHYVDDDY